MNGQRRKISVVVPIYNEESVLPEFLQRTLRVFEALKEECEFEMIFALDPSSDGTEETLQRYCLEDPRIKYLKFSRKIGQPMATFAGIDHAAGDACIVIDVDLQDPPELIPQMIEKWREGYHVVLPQRRSRKGETWVKILVSRFGYSLMNKIAHVNIPKEVGDFRLISRRVVEELRKFRVHHGFLRGMVSYVGFRQITVPYDREVRQKGESKYNPFLGSLRIGLNSLFCFSAVLLSWAFLVELALFLLGCLGLMAFLLAKLRIFPALGDGTHLILSFVAFASGIQLVFVGILGEYIGRIYEEVQERPLYTVDKQVNLDEIPIQKSG